jgi:hypothetical protein
LESSMSCDRTRWHRFTVPNHDGALRGKSLAIAVSVAQSATILLWIGQPIIAQAATIQEVARCRAIQINKERWDCFKSLKAPKQNAPKAKWGDTLQSEKKDVVGAKPEDVPRVTTERVSKVQEEDVPRVTTESVLKVQEEDVPRVTTESVLKVQEEDVPRVTAESVPKVQEEDVPRITTESVPQAKSEDFQPVPLPRLGTASDDPASTSSIDHLSVAPGQLVCPDQDSLAATFVAGVMLGSNPERIAKFGCKTIPTDAQVEILHRFPSGLQFLRVVKVNVTSPSQPDSTVGYTFEISR